jgi:hypothetical protein
LFLFVCFFCFFFCLNALGEIERNCLVELQAKLGMASYSCLSSDCWMTGPTTGRIERLLTPLMRTCLNGWALFV